MPVLIREYTPGDAATLAVLMHAAIHANRTRAYTTAQLLAWSPQAMSARAFAARVMDGRSIWVAEDGRAAVLGFIELEGTGHIDCFYSHPAGVGTGTALYDRLETEAVSRCLPRLTVEASEAAHRFFLRMGFATVQRQQVRRNGVNLHNHLMTKALTQATLS